MRRTFIKKEGVVITTLARYLLGEKCGNRLKTIDELATECRSSVGLTQAALKTLESSGAIRIERRGRNGSYRCYRKGCRYQDCCDYRYGW